MDAKAKNYCKPLTSQSRRDFKFINLVTVVIDPKVNAQRNYMCFPRLYTLVSYSCARILSCVPLLNCPSLPRGDSGIIV